MSKLITYVCPSCGGQILHDADSQTDSEVCSFCGTQHSLTELSGDSNISGKAKSAGASTYMGASGGTGYVSVDGDAMVSYIDESESALAFLENYFETYDWDSFCNYATLAIPTIDRMVEKMLIKSAANAATWELQFTAIHKPLQKKLSGLKALEEKFFASYVNNDDLAESFTYFDTYLNIVKRLVVSRDDVLKKLAAAIKNCKRYGGADNLIKSLMAQLEAVSTGLQKLKVVSSYKELSGFAKASAEKQKRVAARLAEKGIDAETVYNEAVEQYEAGGDPRHALEAFLSIAGYKDALEYAQKIDSWFRFEMTDGTVIKLGKKHYILHAAKAYTFSVANPTGQTVPQQTQTGSYELYDVVNVRQAKEPCVTGITDILAHFGGALAYVKNSTEICIFNSENGAETSVLDFSRKSDIKFVKDSDGDILIDDNKLFLLCKLAAIKKTEEKKHLFRKNKPSELVVVNKNNFSLITIDMVNSSTETVIPELVDIQEQFGKEIFYNKVTTVDNKEKDELFAYNYVTKETRKVLSTDTDIVDVIDGNVIYFVWKPNMLNMDMYALNLATDETIKLAANVYKYYGHIEGKAYYLVGNKKRAVLYCVDVDGQNTKQIRSNVGFFSKALCYLNGWLYVTVGVAGSYNYALAKLKANGEGFTVLCPQLKKLIKIKDGYVYYIDKSNNLCMVREDGSYKKVIIDEIEGFVHLADNAIFMLRREIVDDNNGNDVYANSLYKVDYDGAGLTKVAFNVVNAATNNSDDNEIYLYRAERVNYMIQTPIDKDNYNTTYETRTRNTISVYNIAEDKFTDIAVSGDAIRPGAPFVFKAGCFKKVTKEVIVTEIKTKKVLRRTNKLTAGSIANEQLEEARAAEAAANAK